MVESFVKGVDCEVKKKGEVLIYTLNKIPPHSLNATCAHRD